MLYSMPLPGHGVAPAERACVSRGVRHLEAAGGREARWGTRTCQTHTLMEVWLYLPLSVAPI